MGLVLPCSIGVATRFIYIFILLNLLYFLRERKVSKLGFFREPGTFLLVFYFFVSFFGIIGDMPGSLKAIEKYIIMIAFPVIIFLNGEKYRMPQSRSALIGGFVAGNLLVGIVNVGLAFYNSIRITDGGWVFDTSVYGGAPFWFSLDHIGNYFFSHHFTNFIHPTYWSLYLTIAIGVLLLGPPYQTIPALNKRGIRYSLVAFFLIMFSLAASRAGMLGLTFTLLVLVIVKLRKRRSRIRVALASLVLFGTLLSVILVNPKTTSLIDELRTGSYDVSPRMASWVASVRIIKEHWALGVGLHNVERALINQYLAMRSYENAQKEYNSHQQFLETFVGLGIAGFVILLLVFVCGFIRAYQRSDALLFLFMANLGIHFMLESMLDRFHGIGFLALFYPVLMYTAGVTRMSELNNRDSDQTLLIPK